MLIAQLTIAFVTAAFFAALELITRDYPRTFSFIKKSWALWIYTFTYGFISLLSVLVLDSTELIKVEGLGLANPLVRAFAVGTLVKAFLHIRLFNATVGTQSFPVGVETLTQTFEPYLLQTIDFYHFSSVRAFLQPYTERYKDIREVKRRIKDNLPPNLAEDVKKGMTGALEKGSSIVELMDSYLRLMGKHNFKRVFPPDQEPASLAKRG